MLVELTNFLLRRKDIVTEEKIAFSQHMALGMSIFTSIYILKTLVYTYFFKKNELKEYENRKITVDIYISTGKSDTSTA